MFFLGIAQDVEMLKDLLAGTTFKGPITKVAELTVLDAFLVAFTFTDEV